MKAVADFVSDRVELTKLESFTTDFASTAELSDKDLFALQIILEELVTNVIDYGQIPTGQPAAKVELSVENDALKILLTDYGPEFNPLLRDDPDTTLPADQRQIGGLGIHFCKKLTELQTYERRGNSNVLMLVRRLHP